MLNGNSRLAKFRIAAPVIVDSAEHVLLYLPNWVKRRRIKDAVGYLAVQKRISGRLDIEYMA